MTYIRKKKSESLLQYFNRLPRVINSNGCWIAQSRAHNYGMAQIEGEPIYLHRLSAHLFLGLDLKDKTKQANHKTECIDTLCFNPDHLYVGSQKDNVGDIVFLGNHRNQKKLNCPTCGGPYRKESRGTRYCRKCKTQAIKERRHAIKAS